uniref:Uncharacterized protein n=1 Tax=Cacopsylla melanoneura TaxID=428564 RepID=A0A8D8ZVT0_9HEMI
MISIQCSSNRSRCSLLTNRLNAMCKCCVLTCAEGRCSSNVSMNVLKLFSSESAFVLAFEYSFRNTNSSFLRSLLRTLVASLKNSSTVTQGKAGLSLILIDNGFTLSLLFLAALLLATLELDALATLEVDGLEKLVLDGLAKMSLLVGL